VGGVGGGVVDRFKREGERGPRHFAFGEASSEVAAPPDGDFLSDSHLYRRRPMRPAKPLDDRLDSKTQWFIGSNAAFVVWSNASSTTTGRSEADIAADGLDGLVFNLVEAGRYTVECALGRSVFEAGAIYMFDTTVPYDTITEHDRSVTLFIPRARVLRRLGRFPAQHLLRDLAPVPLAAFVSAQMTLLGARLHRVPAADFEVALDNAVDLALSLAEAELRKPVDEADLLFEAASKLIEARHHEADLTPEVVAKSLRCSRTTLYRAFSGRGLTVAGLLRDTRMRHVVRALALPDTRTIAEIAHACGFGSDPSAFTKLFRRIYSMSPAEARAALGRGEKLRPERRNQPGGR